MVVSPKKEVVDLELGPSHQVTLYLYIWFMYSTDLTNTIGSHFPKLL